MNLHHPIFCQKQNNPSSEQFPSLNSFFHYTTVIWSLLQRPMCFKMRISLNKYGIYFYKMSSNRSDGVDSRCSQLILEKNLGFLCIEIRAILSVIIWFVFKDLFIFILCIWVLCPHVCAPHACLQRAKCGLGSSGTGIMDGCESPCGF